MLTLSRLRLLTAGESHGPALVGILEGAPAGFPIDIDPIDDALRRRQKSVGAGGRMKIESDRIRIKSGVVAGKTTGGPIALEIVNRDYENWKEKNIDPMTVPRPGHADLTGAIKYNHPDLRWSLERASARETAIRVAAGALLQQMLGQFGVRVGGYVQRIGSVEADVPPSVDPNDYHKRMDRAEASPLSCPVAKVEKEMTRAIEGAHGKGETVGGILEIAALNVPPGLGSYAQGDRRLEPNLAASVMAIQAVKGVEIGPAFENSTLLGRSVHDEIRLDDHGELMRETNRAGGIEGGISTGAPIVIRAAMKPISTTLNPTQSVDLADMTPKEIEYERSDIRPLPRAVVVGEAAVAVVVADALFEKLGGDSLREMTERFATLRTGKSDEFELTQKPIRFDYPV